MSTNEPPYKDTARLRYRLLSSGDQKLYCDLFTSPEVMRFVGTPLSADKALSSFQKALALMQQPFGWRMTTLIERATDRAVGISSLRLVDAKARRAEVGSMLLPSVQTKGYGPEYSEALIKHAFRERPVDEMCAQVATGHTAIETLLSGLGFKPGASVPAASGYVARRIWSITRSAWNSRP